MTYIRAAADLSGNLHPPFSVIIGGRQRPVIPRDIHPDDATSLLRGLMALPILPGTSVELTLQGRIIGDGNVLYAGKGASLLAGQSSVDAGAGLAYEKITVTATGDNSSGAYFASRVGAAFASRR